MLLLWFILSQMSAMHNFFIYPSSYTKKNEQGEKITCSVTVIFCDRDTIDVGNLQSEIKSFYEANYQTEEIFVIGGKYCKLLEKIFVTDQLKTFKEIPKLYKEHLSKSLYLFTFDKGGKLECINNPKSIKKEITDLVIHEGLVLIFKKRGGLIEAKGDAHHFVFPSGKHCNKFLRTGNILLHSSEIYFIAFTLLSKYKEDFHKQIYCDTSSINTLAFALLELKRKLVGKNFKIIPVESFSSYTGIFAKSTRFFTNSLILISSSTSGNIKTKLKKHHPDVGDSNIVILYFLGAEKDYKTNDGNIICNLTHSTSNPSGLTFYDTYTESDCVYCYKGSYAVEVKGDVFLLEKPKINRVTIKVSDTPKDKNLSHFIDQFKAKSTNQNNILKVNYKENSQANNKYEVYFDMHLLLSKIENKRSKLYTDFKQKLYDYINQYIPSNAKYFITLEDEGSKKLAEIIISHIKSNYVNGKLPKIIRFNDVDKALTNIDEEGAVVIIGSCISNGKNLLFLSKQLRSYENLRLIYFIGLSRTNNEQYFELLKSNLKQGTYGKESSSFIAVENFYCNNDSKNTSWFTESDFIKNLIDFIDEKKLPKATKFFNNRIKIITDSLSSNQKGLANQLFYPNSENKQLSLRKGFAFFKFQNYINDVSQADIYFTIAAVINTLRNSNNYEQCLRQTEFVRNIIDPQNFNRYNDGIIQACILRNARASELSYNIDDELSSEMKDILLKIIEKHETPQGEGLLEFLYAICIKKLTLKKEHLILVLKNLDAITSNEIVQAFNLYIKYVILAEKPTLY